MQDNKDREIVLEAVKQNGSALYFDRVGRKKYEISESRLFLVKNNMDVEFLDLGNEIPTQVDILASKRYN